MHCLISKMNAGRTRLSRGRWLLLVCVLPALQATLAEWSMWMGDSGSGAAGLGRTIDPARVAPPTHLWSSEARFGGVRAHVPDNRRALDEKQFDLPHMAGYGSPIAAEGKVFFAHYRPSGTLYDKHVAHRQLKMTQAELNAQRGEYPDGLVRKHERWLTGATDVLTCIDAASGRTLWETDLGTDGINFNLGNKTGMGVTAAYHQGRVFVFGTSGNLYAVDAASGAVLWTSDIGERAVMQRMYLQMAQSGYSFTPRFRSSFLTAVVAADGVVVVSDEIFHRVDLGAGTDYHYDRQNGPMAFDASTGQRLWHRPEEGGGCPPVLWTHGNRAYVVSAGNSGVSLIEITSGRQIWRTGFGHGSRRSIGPAVAGDYMVINERSSGEDAGPPEAAAYRLTLSEPQLLWRYPHEPDGNFVIAGERGYAVMDGQLCCFEMSTGRLLARTPFVLPGGTGGNAYLLYYGGWLLAPARGSRGIQVVSSLPGHFGRVAGVIPVEYAPGYENVILPAFSQNRMFVRAKFSIEAFLLPQ